MISVHVQISVYALWSTLQHCAVVLEYTMTENANIVHNIIGKILDLEFNQFASVTQAKSLKCVFMYAVHRNGLSRINLLDMIK